MSYRLDYAWLGHAWLGQSWLAGVVLLACGCASNDEVDPCRHRVCDIDELECIEQVSATVACQLGETEVLVPVVRFVSADELLAELEAEVEPLTPEQEQDVTDYYRGEALVGLMPATYEYEPPAFAVADWAAAFYSTTDGEIVVITDNFDSSDPETGYRVLVHEMVHAYQDHARDLDTVFETHATSFDRSLGLRAAIEGEAMVYQAFAEVELAGLRPARVDWDGYFAQLRDYALGEAATTNEPSMRVAGLFPYPYGVEFMYYAHEQDGRTGIDAVFETPPDSVRQVIGGWSYWPTDLQNGDDLLDGHAVPALPVRYTYLGGGHQSVWLLNAMLQRTAGYPGEWASSELGFVSADYLSIYRDEQSSDLIAIWRIQTDHPSSLSYILYGLDSVWGDAATAGPGKTHVFDTVGGGLVLVATTGPDALLVLADIAGWQSLEALQTETPVTRMRRSQREILAQARPHSPEP
jgi:hypothetical protein